MVQNGIGMLMRWVIADPKAVVIVALIVVVTVVVIRRRRFANDIGMLIKGLGVESMRGIVAKELAKRSADIEANAKILQSLEG